YATLLKQARRLYRRGQIEQAASVAESALAANPGGEAAMVVLGNCSFDRGDLGAAIGWADQALERNSNNADANLLKGSVLQHQNRPADARHFYERYLELAPRGEYAQDVRAI